ncbi:MAG: PAS domain S-box protein [Ignavibacteria bacterium]|nr:PAS domain S-box protein [Ignavibacteria bacterium]
MIVYDLVLKLSLLVTLAVLSGFIDRFWPRKTLIGKIFQGILFGFTSIVGMIFPFELAQGLIFDGRTIIISLSTLFFGPISGGIAALMSFVYRTYVGGVGLPMGLATIVEAFIVGLYFYRIKERRDIFWLNTLRLYSFGFIVHIIMVLLVFMLPSKYAKSVWDEVALTIISVYPVVSLLIGKILLDQEISSRYLKDLIRRESLYRTTLYSIGDAIITTDANGFIHNMNSVAEALTGWTEKNARGREINQVFRIVNEFTLKEAENPVERVLREGKVVGLANHTVLISRDGRKIPIADSGAPIKDENGNIIGVVLVFRDQTKEREYLRKIEEQEKRYRQFVLSSSDGIWRFDIDTPININLPIEEQIKLIFQGGYLAECNDAYAKMYGFEKAEDIVGIRLIDVLKPEDQENIEYLTNFIKNGYRLTGGISKEYDKYGNVLYIENNLVGIIEDGYLIRAWGTQKNITEKYFLELSLKESEEKFRLLSEASLVGIYLIQDYKFIYVNQALANVFGYEIDEIVNKLGPLDLTHPDYRPIVIENINKRISGEIESINYSFKAVKKDGSTIFIEVFGKRIEFRGKPAIIGTLMDITEKLRLEEENRIRNLQLESTLENTPNVAIQFYNIKGEVLYWNKASETVYGWTKDEALGKTLDQLMLTKEETAKFLSVLQEVYSTGNPVGPNEWKVKRKDGSEAWILSSIFAIPSKVNEKIIVCANVDITERKNVEIALKEQNDLFQTLINTLEAAILLYRGKDIVFCNDATSKITGYSLEELYSIPIWDLVHPDQREKVKNIVLARFRNEEVPNRYEIKILKKDGSTGWVDYSVGMIKWKGELTAIGTAIDITERKLNEEIIQIQYNIADALVKQKSLYKFFEVVRKELSKVLDTKNLFVAFYDDEKDELYSPFEWDEKMDGPTRWSAKKSLTGKVIKEKRSILLKKEEIQKEIEDGQIELIGSLAESWLGVPLIVENRAYGALVVQSYDNPNSFDERSVRLMEIIASQLSTYIIQKMQTDELTKLSLAISKSQVGVAITDVNGIIEFVNPKMCEITGYSSDELIGKKMSILKSGYHTNDFYANMWSTILSGKDWSGELLNKKKDGQLYWEKTLISPIFNEFGKIQHFVSIKEDITEQKKLINELIQAKEKALESEKLKTAFLANLSHEVRTPLNGLMGFAQILETQDLSNQEVKRFANIIIKKANELLSLFNDILDLSMIETGQLRISPKSVKLNSILYDVYSSFLVEDKIKNKEIEFRIGKLLPEDFEIVTDPIRLKQVLYNLVNNAIKFTKRGFVEFGAVKDKNNTIQFYVKDTGIGIAKEKFDYIFERFQQIDTDFLRREYQGAGIGLPLCKGLVKLLGGDIWLESQLGEGSTFYFTISSLSSIEKETLTKEKFSFKFDKIQFEEEITILIAEDDYVNFVVLEKMLSKNYNCEVLHANTGKEAIEFVNKRKDINIILLDIRMPIVDGYSAFKEIKKINPSIPIIAVTAYSYSDDKRKIVEMGFDDYVSKPYDFEEIIEKINRAILKTKTSQME